MAAVSNLGVYAFKTLRKHRVLWKDPTRGAERPQEPRSSASWGGGSCIRHAVAPYSGRGPPFLI